MVLKLTLLFNVGCFLAVASLPYFVESMRCVGTRGNPERDCLYPDECGVNGNCPPSSICNLGNCTIDADCCSGGCVQYGTRMACQNGHRAGCMHHNDCSTGCCKFDEGSNNEKGLCGYLFGGWGCILM